MILDTYHRAHNYLRISLTDNCNLRCFYCMPEEDYTFTPQPNLMKREEIRQLSEVFVQEGVTKIRLTGGEPLVRKDAAAIILDLAKLPIQLTLTTNGTRLHEFADVLAEAGIHSLNISLDTLDPAKFRQITRRDLFQQVMDNIQSMIAKGFHVKVNMVVMKDFNDGEINDFIAWTKSEPIHLRFIEFMPFTGNKWTSNKVFTWKQILETVEQQYSFLPLEKEKSETAKKYIIPGHAGTFAVISTMSANFCGDCNRMRLTADGKLKNCLFSKEETDLLTPLRKGEAIAPLIHQNIRSKAKELGGQFTANYAYLHADNIQNRSMISIGG